MATQTGSIDLRGASSAKLYVDDEAGEIRSEVSETYATKTEVRRTDTGSGTVVSSDDAANLPPLSLTIHGKSVQDGTPSPSSPVEIQSVKSRNLLEITASQKNINGTTFTPQDDGSVIVNGTPNPAAYYLCASITLAAGTYAFSGYVDGVLVATTTHCRIYIHVPSHNISTNSGTSFTLTQSAEANVYIQAYVNQAYNAEVFGIQLEHGALVHPWQPYQHIKAAITGKNLLNPSGFYLAQANGPTPTVGADGRITISGTVTGAYQYVLLRGAMMPVEHIPSYSGTLTNLRLRVYDVTAGMDLWRSDNASLQGPFTPTEGNDIRVYLQQISVNTATSFDGYVQLEYGSEATEYEPYTDASAFIPLQGNALHSLPDGTEDTLEVDGEGNVTLTQRVGSVTLDGTEDWTVISGRNYGTYTGLAGTIQTPPNTTTPTNSYCNLVPPVQAQNASATPNIYITEGIAVGSTGNVFLNLVGNAGGTTVDALKAALAATPAEFLYPLATPQTISLGTIDLPSLPSPSFSLHVDALATPTIDAEWWTQGGEEVGSVYQRTSALEQDVDGLTLELSEKVDSSEEWVSWLHAGTDATTHEPYLAMGKNSAYPSVVYGSDAARFYDGEGDAAANVVASFGTEGVVVGKDGSANTTISDSEIVFHDADGNEAGKISMSSEGAVPASASHTITAGNFQQTYTLEGLTPLPDFTLGSLVVDLLYNGTLNRRYTYTSIASAAFTVSIDTYTDATFTAAQSGDTWGATMTAQHRVVGETADFTFSLKWVYRGTAPMYEFGTAENTGAYSFSAGTGLVAAGQSQAVFGTYNEPSETDLFILGNGTSDGNRSNALKVDAQGTLETSGYFQSGGTVGLGTEAQQGWLTALGPFLRFAEVTTATQSISSGSIAYYDVAAPTYTGYTLRGAIQAWTSGSGTVIIGASYRSSSDNHMHFVVRANNSASIAVKALLLYTRDAITFTS